MRIIIEPTRHNPIMITQQHRIALEIEQDDVSLPAALELIEFCLRGYGYNFTGQLDIIDYGEDAQP